MLVNNIPEKKSNGILEPERVQQKGDKKYIIFKIN